MSTQVFDLAQVVASGIDRAHVDAIKATEWAGRAGYNGGWVPSCPSCHGIKPGYWHGWLKEAHGHSEECALLPALEWLTEKTA